MTVNGNVSFWFAEDGLPGQRTPLTGDTTADVAIVGAGYTGLWTAYYLKKADPSLTSWSSRAALPDSVPPDAMADG